MSKTPKGNVFQLISFICTFLFFINLFIWLRQVCVAARGFLSSCGAWAPEHAGSVVAVCRLRCPMVVAAHGLSSCESRAQ